MNPISDRSRPGSTMTAIGTVDLQGTDGKCATVGQKRRGGRRVHRQRENWKSRRLGLRVRTLSDGTMIGKAREKIKVDILCV